MNTTTPKQDLGPAAEVSYEDDRYVPVVPPGRTAHGAWASPPGHHDDPDVGYVLPDDDDHSLTDPGNIALGIAIVAGIAAITVFLLGRSFGWRVVAVAVAVLLLVLIAAGGGWRAWRNRQRGRLARALGLDQLAGGSGGSGGGTGRAGRGRAAGKPGGSSGSGSSGGGAGRGGAKKTAGGKAAGAGKGGLGKTLAGLMPGGTGAGTGAKKTGGGKAGGKAGGKNTGPKATKGGGGGKTPTGAKSGGRWPFSWPFSWPASRSGSSEGAAGKAPSASKKLGPGGGTGGGQSPHAPKTPKTPKTPNGSKGGQNSPNLPNINGVPAPAAPVGWRQQYLVRRQRRWNRRDAAAEIRRQKRQADTAASRTLYAGMIRRGTAKLGAGLAAGATWPIEQIHRRALARYGRWYQARLAKHWTKHRQRARKVENKLKTAWQDKVNRRVRTAAAWRPRWWQVGRQHGVRAAGTELAAWMSRALGAPTTPAAPTAPARPVPPAVFSHSDVPITAVYDDGADVDVDLRPPRRLSSIIPAFRSPLSGRSRPASSRLLPRFAAPFSHSSRVPIPDVHDDEVDGDAARRPPAAPPVFTPPPGRTRPVSHRRNALQPHDSAPPVTHPLAEAAVAGLSGFHDYRLPRVRAQEDTDWLLSSLAQADEALGEALINIARMFGGTPVDDRVAEFLYGVGRSGQNTAGSSGQASASHEQTQQRDMARARRPRPREDAFNV